MTDCLAAWGNIPGESFHVALHKGDGKRGANPNTIRARLSSLGFLGKYGARKHILPTNPLDGYERPKRKRPQEKWLQPLELLAWLEVKRPLRVNIVRDLLVDLGLRVSELCAANWGDITELQGIAYLSVIVKGGHPKRVPISPEVATALHEWRLACNIPDPVEPILRNERGRRMSRGELSYLTQSRSRGRDHATQAGDASRDPSYSQRHPQTVGDRSAHAVGAPDPHEPKQHRLV